MAKPAGRNDIAAETATFADAVQRDASAQALAPLRAALDESQSHVGASPMAFSYGSIHRYLEDTPLMPGTAEIFAYLVVTGAVRLTLPAGIVEYMPGQYFLSSLIKGVASHAKAIAAESPHLALRFDFTTEDVISVLLDMEVNFTGTALEKSAAPALAGHDQPAFTELTHRMTHASLHEASNAFLAKHFKRELIYLIVTGPHGNAFVQDILNIRNTKDIYLTNDWIRSNYKTDFAVDDLAELANMSVSSFHRKFKTAIGMGPLQCQKQLRLVEARRLMLDEAYSVTAVSLEVGYESLSQFSRDYKRMFGLSPQRDVQALRSQPSR
ncbi:helix-turn-helix domain-containing protein [Pseudomonas amygdali]|uniref:helix-turn-helix domain-containing protein n=1 Tax=Pseudomonas amygdali TaxID=47877 RepID=UPI001FB6EF1C|nr:helix-turn-helix domain-containing protein [Pseudomonas amygdali]UPT36776.1 AraC family transcriptional regulator [Pseudomonas amygdali pv. loropetali]